MTNDWLAIALISDRQDGRPAFVPDGGQVLNLAANSSSAAHSAAVSGNERLSKVIGKMTSLIEIYKLNHVGYFNIQVATCQIATYIDRIMKDATGITGVRVEA